MTIETEAVDEDSTHEYCFKLTIRKMPAKIKYAEDLLQFDSHEFLTSFFGKQNVKKDLYYFSEKELQKCSVLFSGSRYQVVFVWGDENKDESGEFVCGTCAIKRTKLKDIGCDFLIYMFYEYV